MPPLPCPRRTVAWTLHGSAAAILLGMSGPAFAADKPLPRTSSLSWIRLPGADALVRAAIAEQHDVGLSVHLPDCLSRRLATSSKVFEYLMAGLVVVAAEQEGSRHILDERCARFFPPGDDEALARVLAELAADRRTLLAL